MKTEKFNDLFFFGPKSKIKAGDGLKKGRFPFYTSSPILSKWIDTEQHFDEALVFGTGGLASIHYVNEPFSTSTDCLVAIAKTKKSFNVKFVFYYIFSNIQILEQGFKGAGLKHISKPYIQNLDIPLPNLEIQDKIVAILDKAKNLIEKRERTIEMSEELLRATFLDMFGDSILNPKGWTKVHLEFLCSKIIDCPHETPEYIDGKSDYYCVRSSDIQRNYLDLKETKTVSQETYLGRISRHKPNKGEVIYTREGGRLGNAARVPENYNICLGQRMMLFIADKKVANNEFIWGLLNSDSIKKQVINMSGGGAAPRINIRQLRTLEVIKPTVELQNLFASRVNKIDLVTDKFKQSLKEINNLFNSLSQKAFVGDLDFNTAVDLEVLLENDYQFFKENSDVKSIQLLLERLDKCELNEKKFYEQEIYDKAKGFVFELLQEETVKQVFDEKTKRVKLTV
ncbi:restriction endonuclease subunit S [Chryseobacterium sp. HSC-36S06]|uniref:restriction endonuclease subunit S n=1 Tax=Chryseobacterium sp. HSC-36S06 TaxID=2910970 RepID=UPI00209ECCAB|nr:restriction endonuclease subunit S [Chryseobacterium sp. HSC-36S06]MCP2037979.1 type I restriction enzyme S subunit [Chryseobacterium sp. HSC-36S06]